MKKLRYPMNIIQNGYNALSSCGLTADEISQIRSDRKQKVESLLSAYMVSDSQILFFNQQIESEHEKMSGSGSSGISDMPRGPFNPMAIQDRYAACIDKITAWEKKRDAVLSLQEKMQAAFKAVDASQMQILTLCYGLNGTEAMRIDEICETLRYSKTSIHRIKANAIEILAFHLIGPVVSTSDSEDDGNPSDL